MNGLYNGAITDGVQICHRCQQPGASVRSVTGEWYHADCLPEEFKP